MYRSTNPGHSYTKYKIIQWHDRRRPHASQWPKPAYHCAVFIPHAAAQRTAPTLSTSFATTLEADLHRQMPDRLDWMVELVRCTRQGGYQVQLFAYFFLAIKALLQSLSINLPNFRRWKLAPTTTPGGSIALVMGGVPLNV